MQENICSYRYFRHDIESMMLNDYGFQILFGKDINQLVN